jgi:hypothetical protein
MMDRRTWSGRYPALEPVSTSQSLRGQYLWCRLKRAVSVKIKMLIIAHCDTSSGRNENLLPRRTYASWRLGCASSLRPFRRCCAKLQRVIVVKFKCSSEALRNSGVQSTKKLNLFRISAYGTCTITLGLPTALTVQFISNILTLPELIWMSSQIDVLLRESLSALPFYALWESCRWQPIYRSEWRTINLSD